MKTDSATAARVSLLCSPRIINMSIRSQTERQRSTRRISFASGSSDSVSRLMTSSSPSIMSSGSFMLIGTLIVAETSISFFCSHEQSLTACRPNSRCSAESVIIPGTSTVKSEIIRSTNPASVIFPLCSPIARLSATAARSLQQIAESYLSLTVRKSDTHSPRSFETAKTSFSGDTMPRRDISER